MLLVYVMRVCGGILQGRFPSNLNSRILNNHTVQKSMCRRMNTSEDCGKSVLWSTCNNQKDKINLDYVKINKAFKHCLCI